ncbi:DNA phosphorothioation-dependent restriction protein DptF [Tepidibacter sp. Z1-5]|uniref:DNA phosphorothioation-dependent restriction protein DptF n=1 Tax=Tepidibacter sp. Z1-5 TaxID=3134138 RepID=UPI0030BA4B4D
MESKICLVEELKKLKESSKEAVENLNSFSPFKEYIHVKRKVQDELFHLLQKTNESNKSQLILVCGGVGDGKSHLISYFMKYNSDLMNNFEKHNDATESFEPQKTSIDTLNDVLDAFSDENIENSNEKFILAINLGALNNFIDSEYKDRFKKLRKYVIEKGILESSITDNSFDESSNFQFINFSDYHMYSLKEDGPRSEYIEDIINKITNDHKENIFYKSYKNYCLSCENKYKCPVKLNYEMLMKDNIKSTVSTLLIEAIVKHKMIVSTRSLLNFVYDFIVNNNLDNMNTKELQKEISSLELIDTIKYMFTSNLFEHSELSNILSSVSTLDSVHIRNEELDSLIIKLNITDDMSVIFREYLQLDEGHYLENTIGNKEALEEAFVKSKLKRDSDILKENLIKMFIRLYLFIPNNDEINLKDNIYNQYMKDLYNWNKGLAKKLKRVYDDVKSSIYKWNGESIEGNINIFIGKNQMRYKVSQTLNIDADISNLNKCDEEELHKFNSNLILRFKNEEKNKSHEIDIDFNLYSLLMAIKNGYRPNKTDKYNYINFVEFINKMTKLGTQSKEVIIEDRSGNTSSKYKLVYDKNFESYKFESINGV